MNVSLNDYVIFTPSDSKSEKRSLAKVIRPPKEDGSLRVQLEEHCHLRDTTEKIQVKDVTLNLGKNPAPGKVYGCDTRSLYVGKYEHDYFPDFHFFCRPPNKTAKTFLKAADRVAKILDKNGIGFVLQAPCVYEIRPKTTKYAGMYTPEKKDLPARIFMAIDEDVVGSSSITTYEYVLLHEIGHLVHLMYLRPFVALNAKWIRTYSTSIKPRVVTPQALKDLFKQVAYCETGVVDLIKGLEDDDEKANFLVMMKWLKEVKGITIRELDTLIRDGDNSSELIKDLWPSIPIQSKSLSPVVTEYACKNYKELFAESFAFHLLGKKLPKSISKLMDRSLQYCISNENLDVGVKSDE